MSTPLCLLSNTATSSSLVGAMYRPPDPTSSEAGPSRPRLESSKPLPPSEQPDKPKKRRRLQFTSQLRTSIQRYNPDGTETVEYLHQQSTQRLKRKWDSIFERFKDAHLQEQDEIYLGNRANGEPIVVVKDRGSLRSLRQSMEFGVFIKDEELQGWKDRPEAREMQEQGDDDEDDFDPSRMPSSHRAQITGASSSESESDEEDPAANDPDLREFLQAEARRKAMLGKVDEDEGSDQQEGDDHVVDFADPMWNNYQPTPTSIILHPSKQVSSAKRRLSHPAAPSQPQIDTPDLVLSSSEDDNDTDIVTVHSDSDEELIDSIQTKRQNIEELLRCTTPFETLPYNDIFGLADLLKITDNTSRLYVDLVSDDEDEAASADADKPMGGNVGNEEVIDLTSSMPNSSLVVDAASSPLFELASSRASSVIPVAPASERSASPEDATLSEAPSLQPTTVQPTHVEVISAEVMPSEAKPIAAETVQASGAVAAQSPKEDLSPAEDAPAVVWVEPRQQDKATPPPPGPPSLQSAQLSQPESIPAVSASAVVETPLSKTATPPPPSAPAPATSVTPESAATSAAQATLATPANPTSPATPSRVTPSRETQPSQPTSSRHSSQNHAALVIKASRLVSSSTHKAAPF
ncbi:hypothetical protein EX895_002192 [Sporisorium graminicola]|uniref:Uncharacterized protein n=1 Tax=Sporisorium graminicola TaxID=280036 RepID=A0A4U7KW89_9BASI|nr:hypothetical protein EX895_002192 [Sporisorium graminicola]TKY88951.1 hypothetical protein EX895_002192 [Sporisorium graminicola]